MGKMMTRLHIAITKLTLSVKKAAISMMNDNACSFYENFSTNISTEGQQKEDNKDVRDERQSIHLRKYESDHWPTHPLNKPILFLWLLAIWITLFLMTAYILY